MCFKYTDVHYYLFSKSGFMEDLVKLAEQEEKLHLFDMVKLQ
jgi:hypothetical protein